MSNIFRSSFTFHVGYFGAREGCEKEKIWLHLEILAKPIRVKISVSSNQERKGDLGFCSRDFSRAYQRTRVIGVLIGLEYFNERTRMIQYAVCFYDGEVRQQVSPYLLSEVSIFSSQQLNFTL